MNKRTNDDANNDNFHSCTRSNKTKQNKKIINNNNNKKY